MLIQEDIHLQMNEVTKTLIFNWKKDQLSNESSESNTIKDEGDCDVNNQYYVTIEGNTIKGRYRHPINHSPKGQTGKGASM